MASVTSALLVPYCFLSPDPKEKNKAFLARMEKKPLYLKSTIAILLIPHGYLAL